MADPARLSRMKARKADLEAKLQRLNGMTVKDQPGLDLAKKQTANWISQIDTEIKNQSQL